jgi:hypothetical protein
MAQKRPKRPASSSVTIKRFGGLELREGVVSLDPCRSPDALNMLLDADGLPAKRTGTYGYWGFAGLGDRVHGLHNIMIDGEQRLMVHAGSHLWLLRPDGATHLYDKLAEAPSTGFSLSGRYFLLDGTGIYKVTGSSATPALINPYEPLTRRRARPDGSGSQGGEEPNFLTAMRRNSFVTDGETAVFQLDAYPVAGTVEATLQDGSVKREGQGLNVYQHAGQVTFSAPPSAGEEGVVIRFKAAGWPVDVDKAIAKTRRFGIYGSTVYLTGNPDLPAFEWGSPDIDRAYFPRHLCGYVGDPGTPIAGYLQHQEALVILKRPGNDSGLYLRLGEAPPQPGGEAPPAIGGIAQLGDMGLYLSRQGIMEVTGSGRAGTRGVRLRSQSVAPLLEDLPEHPVAYVHDQSYYLTLKDGLLVGARSPVGEGLEWNVWRTFAPRYLATALGRLCFAEIDRLYYFKKPGDYKTYTDEEQDFDAYWTSPPLQIGQLGDEQSLTDLFVTLRPQSHTEVEVAAEGHSFEPTGALISDANTAGSVQRLRLRPPSAPSHRIRMACRGLNQPMRLGPLRVRGKILRRPG